MVRLTDRPDMTITANRGRFFIIGLVILIVWVSPFSVFEYLVWMFSLVDLYEV